MSINNKAWLSTFRNDFADQRYVFLQREHNNPTTSRSSLLRSSTGIKKGYSCVNFGLYPKQWPANLLELREPPEDDKSVDAEWCERLLLAILTAGRYRNEKKIPNEIEARGCAAFQRQQHF